MNGKRRLSAARINRQLDIEEFAAITVEDWGFRILHIIKQLSKRPMIACLAGFLGVAIHGSAAAQTYSFPFKGEDLKPGERIHLAPPHAPGIQARGYDIGAFRYTGSGRWSRLKVGGSGSEPKDHVIHGVYGRKRGLPFYAMASGEVIGCWRNSPDDPASGKEKKVIGGGNHVWIRQDDGRIALFAHAAAGSIPTSVCPYNEIYTKNDPGFVGNPDVYTEALVPRNVAITVPTGTVLPSGVTVKRPRVKQGQLLGRVGYTGSTGRVPHLHIHMETGGASSQPALIKFARGLTTPVTKVVDFNTMEADINAWSAFPNNRIPNGDQFIWPARTLTAEYARHGFPSADFQRLFDHLSDSGFWPEWIDGYSVGGEPFLNFVWRPAKNKWRAFFLVPEKTYQTEINKAKAAGYQPYQVESSLVGGRVRYTMILRKGMAGRYLARHGLTVQQHDAVFKQARQQGLNPINDSVISQGGKLYLTSLYRSNTIGEWQLKPIVLKKDYQELYNQNARQGRRPRYVQSYKHRNKVYYSVIFASAAAGARKDRHNMSTRIYQSEYNSALRAGLLTRAVSGTDNAASNHEYIAVWKK
ncbi:MAG: hypothetical protein ABFS45_23650 [Pseudomonadota bacterium]